MVGVADAKAGPEAFLGSGLDPVVTQRRIFELTDPRLTVTVDQVERAGRDLLVLTVPASPDVHAVGGRSTERIGTSCQPMSNSRIATVVAERRGDDWSAQDSDLDLAALDALATGQARSMLERSSDPLRRGYARESDADLMRVLGLVTAHGTLANAGALLFTRHLDHPEELSYVYRRTPAGELLVNEHLPTPLLPSIQRTFDLVGARLDRTPVNLPGGQQIQLADLPEAAVREAVINAVMHRDYRRLGVVQVEHTATRAPKARRTHCRCLGRSIVVRRCCWQTRAAWCKVLEPLTVRKNSWPSSSRVTSMASGQASKGTTPRQRAWSLIGSRGNQ